MKIQYSLLLFLLLLGFTQCKSPAAKEDRLSDDALMDTVQRRTFNYFWEGAEPNSGLARERIHIDGVYPENDQNVITSGGSGFGIMAILAGIDRGYVTRQEGLERMEKIVSFLETADRFHGAYPHWWYGDTGKVKPFGQKDNGGDLVETAFIMQALLSVHQYYIDGSPAEQALAARIDKLWREVDWNFLPPERPERALLALESGIRLGNELSRTRLQRMPHHDILAAASPTQRRCCSSHRRGLAAERGHCRPS